MRWRGFLGEGEGVGEEVDLDDLRGVVEVAAVLGEEVEGEWLCFFLLRLRLDF